MLNPELETRLDQKEQKVDDRRGRGWFSSPERRSKRGIGDEEDLFYAASLQEVQVKVI